MDRPAISDGPVLGEASANALACARRAPVSRQVLGDVADHARLPRGGRAVERDGRRSLRGEVLVLHLPRVVEGVEGRVPDEERQRP